MRERAIAPSVLVALTVSLAPSCTAPNPLFHPGDGGSGGLSGQDGGGGGSGGGGKGGADAGSDGGGVCSAGANRSCYTGTPGTNAAGKLCRSGSNYCLDGAWQQACVGEITDQVESCNGLDDNCNGTVDEGFPTISCGLGRCLTQAAPGCAAGAVATCTPGTPVAEICGNGIDDDCDGAIDDDCATPATTTLSCAHVSAMTGDDVAGDGTAARPYATIQKGIAMASTLNVNAVCVAGGASCSAAAVTYQLAVGETIEMANSISVFGNYESTGWTRCSFGAGASVIVTIAPGTATGIEFSSAITSTTKPTVLDGVRIARLDQGDTTAAITIDGAKTVGLSNLFIDDNPTVATSTYGVDIKGGATVTIAQSAIFAGSGTVDAVGVRSMGATPTIRDNCSSIVAGVCTADCSQALGIHGRPAAAAAGTGDSSAVFLQDSPGATVDRNTLCGGPAANGDALRIAGMTSGGSAGIAVRANTIIAAGATVEAHAIRVEACTGAAPWIAGNALIQADGAMGATNLSAIGVTGNCNPVIEHNQQIAGVGDVGKGVTRGIVCDKDGTGGVSQCVIADNALVQGATSTHATQSAAVACANGACGHVVGNVLSGTNGTDTRGIMLSGGRTLVERNTISGGCGHASTVGVLAADTSAFIVNNVVQAINCTSNLPTPMTAAGVRMGLVVGSSNEAEVHSNTIFVGGSSTCTGQAATVYDVNASNATYARGIFFNNIMRGSGCSVAYDFLEESPHVSPRLLQNNDLDPTPAPAPILYSANQGGFSQTYTLIDAVNQRANVVNNVSVDPMFGAFPTNLHPAAVPLLGRGTNIDAPATDFSGTKRTNPPDIGAYQH